MAEQSQLARLGLRTGTVGSSASLAIAFGNSAGTTPNSVHTSATRTGLYADLTGAAEKIGLIVGGQTGPLYTRSGSFVNAVHTGTITSNQNAVALPAGPTGTMLQVGNADGSTTRVLIDAFGTGVGALLTSRLARGTAALPTAVQSGDTLGSHNAYGYGATGYSAAFRGRLAVMAAENWSDTAQGTQIALSITTNTTTTTYDAAVLGNDGVFTLKNGALVGIALAPQGGAANFTGTITTALLSAARTYTFPDASGVVAINAAALGTNQNIPYTNGSGLLQTAAGFVVVGTPSATAPSTGTNGPGLRNGVVYQLADGSAGGLGVAAFGNGAALSSGITTWVCQGTASAPGATISTDRADFIMSGHDGTNFTGTSAAVSIRAGSTWSNTNRESYIIFFTTANGSTTTTSTGRIDPNQTLVWGSNTNSVATFSAGTQRPHIQTAATSTANANMAQSIWINSTAGATQIMAKSRSAAVGTQGVITTGDTLGTMSWQGDDGTNFIASSSIVGVAEGTIGTGQIPGRLVFNTASSAGTITESMRISSAQELLVSGRTAHGGTNATLSGFAQFNTGGNQPYLQVLGGANVDKAGLAVACFTATAGNAPILRLAKSRSNTVGTYTLVNASDNLGYLTFEGADGSAMVRAAQILVSATGTPAAGVMPGNMIIQTAATGGTLTTALTIDNAQTITHNSTTEASAVGTASTLLLGGLGVAKRSYLGTIGGTFKGNVIAGVQDGTAAVTGQVGEEISAVQTTYTNFTSTATYQQLVTIALTAGDWLVYATITLFDNTSTLTANANSVFAISTTTASAAGATEGLSLGYISQNGAALSTNKNTITLVMPISVSATTNYFLNGQATFTGGNPQYVCSFKARRMR